MANDFDIERVLSDENDLKKEINALQQNFVKVEVNTVNNLKEIKNIDTRLKGIEIEAAILKEKMDHIKEDFTTKINLQAENKEKIEKDIKYFLDNLQEVQTSINQIRLAIDAIREKEKEDQAKKTNLQNNLVHPIFVWVVTTVISLLASAVITVVIKNASQQNQPYPHLRQNNVYRQNVENK